MHRTRLLVLLSICVALASFGQAQTVMLDLPLQSQHAVITQRIGLTDITLNYHRPPTAAKSGARLCRTEKSGAPEPTKILPSPSPIQSPSRASRSVREPTACT